MVSKLHQKLVYLLPVFIIVLLAQCNSKNDITEKDDNFKPASAISAEALGDSLLKKSLYDSASFYFNTAIAELKNSGKVNQIVSILLKLAESQRLKGDIDSSMASITKAENLISADRSNDIKLKADILRKKGLLLTNIGFFDSAINVLNRSIDLKVEKLGDRDTSLSLNYNLLGIAYFYKGDYLNALKNYQLAYDLALRRVVPEDADLASYIQNIGIIHAQRGDYEKAEEAFTASLAINEKFRTPNDPELSMNNLNVGRLKALLNKDIEALEYYNKAEDILLKKAEANHPYFIYVYLNKGQTYVHMADYERALTYFNKALSLARQSLEAKHPQVLSINMNIGYVYEKKKDYSNALKYYLASIPDDTNNPSLIKTYSNLASLYSTLNNPSLADEYFQRALQLTEKFMPADHPEKGLLYTRYGYFLLSNPNSKGELDYFNKALEISRKHYGDKSREVSNIYTHIGNYYYMQEDLTEALRNYQKAIIAISGDFNDTDISSNPDPRKIEADRYLVNSLNGKAQVLAEMGTVKDLIQSLSTYKLSVQVIGNLRSTYQDEESKLMISDETKATFQKTVAVAIKLYEATNNIDYLEEAFAFSDKSKSAVLINSINDIEAQHFTKVPSKILSLERTLKLNIGTFKRFIFEEQQKPQPDSELISNWESRVFEFTVRYDSLVNILEQNYPEYYALKYSEPSVKIEDVKNALDKSSVLIEYMLSDSILYSFAISSNSFSYFAHPIDSSFYRDIQAMVSSTANDGMFSITEADYVNYAKAASRLYSILVKPVTAKFKEKKLLVIPDGEIGYVSFDMLLTSMPDTSNMNFRVLDYLIKDKIISYSTSAILQYSNFRKRERKATKNVLVMAPSYDNLVNATSTRFADDNGDPVYLLPIPGVEKELNGIKRSILAKKIRGKDATEYRFKKEVGSYNVLHLAMHTIINNKEPMLSKLVFYQNNDTVEDGLLNTYELLSMDLNANLAVLSACNTGTGKLLKGEGIMNLARGFIYAGVPGIVMTIWSVDDESGAGIISKFYDYLIKGMPKDEALRQAKLDFLEEGDPLRSHPFYWAAYVNIGDNSPIEFRNASLTYALYLLSILILAGGITFFAKRRHSSRKNKISQMA